MKPFVKNWIFGIVGQAACHPKASIFDKLGAETTYLFTVYVCLCVSASLLLSWKCRLSVWEICCRKHSVRFEALETLPVLVTSREQWFFFSLSLGLIQGWAISQNVILARGLNNTPLFHIYHSLFPVTTSVGSPFPPLLCGVNNIWIKKAFQVTIKQMQEGVDIVYMCVFVWLDACTWVWLSVSWESTSRDVAFGVLSLPFNLCKGQNSDHARLWSLHGVSVSETPSSFLTDGLTGSETDFLEWKVTLGVRLDQGPGVHFAIHTNHLDNVLHC